MRASLTQMDRVIRIVLPCIAKQAPSFAGHHSFTHSLTLFTSCGDDQTRRRRWLADKWMVLHAWPLAAARPGNTNAVPVLLFLLPPLLRPTGYRWLAGWWLLLQPGHPREIVLPAGALHAPTVKTKRRRHAHKTKAALSTLLPPPNSMTACMLCSATVQARALMVRHCSSIQATGRSSSWPPAWCLLLFLSLCVSE